MGDKCHSLFYQKENSGIRVYIEIRKYYIRGVGVGLIIAWVTSALAYWKTGSSTEVTLIEFEFIVSLILIIISIFIKEKK